MLHEVFVVGTCDTTGLRDFTVGLRGDGRRDDQGGVQLGSLELGTDRWRYLYLAVVQQRT